VTIPFEPVLFGYKINVHLILEYLAFFVSFRYYVFLRKHAHDRINSMNRLSIILGAIIGAFIASRLMAYLENPYTITGNNVIFLLNSKTIMGGLFGGLLGVELAKKIIGENQSSGDLFTLPIILGIIIGRVGCFLSGTNEFTYGSPTAFFTGMNLGDGINRHPITLYEIAFLLILFFILKQLAKNKNIEAGLIFKVFMITYFTLRFFIEYLKPNIFHVLNLSSIQHLCILCLLYYFTTFKKLILHAYKKIYLL
jgi:phosphatidylglycerol---prolipoprotein diacylglyceryl transferase